MPAERVRDRTHVRPRADAQVETSDSVAIGNDVERVHPRAPHGHLDRNAPAVQPVGALTADLHGGRGRDRQLDLTAEALEPLLQPAGGRCLVRLDHIAFPIARARPDTEIYVGHVALVQSDEA